MTNKEIKKMLKELEDKIDSVSYKDPFNEWIIAGVYIGSLLLALIIQYLMK